MTRRYEVVYIFDSALEEPAVNEKLAQLPRPARCTASEVTVNHWGKRTLTYPSSGMKPATTSWRSSRPRRRVLPEFERAVKLDDGVLRFLVVLAEGGRRPPRCRSSRPWWPPSRRRKNEDAQQDVSGLRGGRPRRGLQGRAHAGPVPDRSRQDPAEPAVGHVRPAPASDLAPPSSGRGSWRCCPTSRVTASSPRLRPLILGALTYFLGIAFVSPVTLVAVPLAVYLGRSARPGGTRCGPWRSRWSPCC